MYYQPSWVTMPSFFFHMLAARMSHKMDGRCERRKSKFMARDFKLLKYDVIFISFIFHLKATYLRMGTIHRSFNNNTCQKYQSFLTQDTTYVQCWSLYYCILLLASCLLFSIAALSLHDTTARYPANQSASTILSLPLLLPNQQCLFLLQRCFDYMR